MRRVKVRDIQVFGQLSAMQCLVEVIMKVQVNDIKLRNRRLPSSEYNTTIDIMQVVVAFVSLIRESTIIIKDAL